MTKQKRLRRGFWIAGIVTALYLPGSIGRLVTMPSIANEPLPAPPIQYVPASETAFLPGIGTARIDVLAKTSRENIVSYSPNGARFTVSPLRPVIEKASQSVFYNHPYLIQASIQADKQNLFFASLDTDAGAKETALPLKFHRWTIVPDDQTGLSTWFAAPSASNWSVRVGVALKQEARTIADAPLWNPLTERSGENLHIGLRSGAYGSTGSSGFTVRLQLPTTLTERFEGKTAAVKIQLVDWIGNARDVPFDYDQAGKVRIRQFNKLPTSIRSIRVVAAPIHWTEFQKVPTKPNRYGTVAPRAFPVTDEAQQFVETQIPVKNTLVVAETNQFPSAEATKPVHDAIVIADSGKVKNSSCAQFWTFVPRSLFGKAKLVAVLTDKHGRKHETEQTEKSTGTQLDNANAVGVKWFFPDVPIGDEQSLSLELRR